MKILYFLLLLGLSAAVGYGQSTLPLRADTVVIEKVGGNATLKLKNATRDSTGGVLYNIGGGVTGFKKSRKLNDTSFTVGGDTLSGVGKIPPVKWYNITDFGADATGVTNVSTYIQSAVLSGRKDIYLPKGVYLLSSTVYLKDSVTIRGDGRNATIIKLTTDIPAFKLGFVEGGHKCTFMDIGFQGTSGTAGTGNQTGILIDSVGGVIVQNVGGYQLGGWVVRIKRNGYCCGTYTSTSVRSNTISNCYAQACYGGFALDTLAEYNTLDNSTAVNGKYGAFVAGGNSRVNNNNLSSNQYGLYITGGGNNGHGVATGNTINHNTNTNIYIDGATNGYAFSNNMIYAGTSQLSISASDNISIQGGDMVGTGSAVINNSTNVHFTDVNMRVPPVWTIIGTAPTVFRNGIVDNAISLFDINSAKQLNIAHTNGTTDFTLPAGSKFRFSDTVAVNTALPLARFHVTGTNRTDGTGFVTASSVVRNSFQGNAPAQFIVNHGGGNWGLNIQRSDPSPFTAPHLTFFKNGGSSMSILAPTPDNSQIGDIIFTGVDSSNVPRNSVTIRPEVERCAANWVTAGLAFFCTDSSGATRLSYFDSHGNLGLGTANTYFVGPGNPFRLHVSDGKVRFGDLRGNGTILTAVDNDGVFKVMKLGTGLSFNAAGDTLVAYGNGGYIILNDSASNVANYDIIFNPATVGVFDRIEILIDKCKPATDNTDLFLRMSADNGTTFDAGASDYEWLSDWRITIGPADGLNTDDADSEASLVQNATNDAAGTLSGKLTLYHPHDAAYRPMYDGDFITNGGSLRMIKTSVGGQRNANQVTSAVRLLFSSGDIAKIKVKVIGYR